MNNRQINQRDRTMSHLFQTTHRMTSETSCMKVTRQNRGQYRQGATMLEFAVVAPLLFLCFFAAFEFCRVAMIKHTAENAVYEGCRKAIIPGGTSHEATNETRRIMNTLGVTDFKISVSPHFTQPTTRQVTVRIEVPLNKNSFVPNQFVTGNEIVRELTLYREGGQ